jgi:flagellar basal-body rod modification protein FlgD
MTVDPATSTNAANGVSQALAQQTGSLGEDAFMQLLVTQLQNQDPTQPQDSSQFVTQLAQFSSLEKLTSMNQELASLTSINASLTQIAQLLSGLGATTPVPSTATTGTQTTDTTSVTNS